MVMLCVVGGVSGVFGVVSGRGMSSGFYGTQLVRELCVLPVWGGGGGEWFLYITTVYVLGLTIESVVYWDYVCMWMYGVIYFLMCLMREAL
jgi:hypothetical protein